MDKQAYQLVRYKTFEIATKRGAVANWRDGKLDWSEVLLSDEVYSNVSKGLRTNESELIAAFETSNNEEVAKIIAKKGHLQLTAAQLREKTDVKRREMINYIHKYYINPKTKKPHPVVRIENAFDAMKVRVDPHTPAERQVQDKVLKRLPEFIPIKKSEMEGTLVVPNTFVGQAMGVLSDWAEIKKENYSASECTMKLAVVPGNYDTLMAKLGTATKNNFTFNVDGMEAASSESDEKNKRGGKKGRGKRGKGKRK